MTTKTLSAEHRRKIAEGVRRANAEKARAERADLPAWPRLEDHAPYREAVESLTAANVELAKLQCAHDRAADRLEALRSSLEPDLVDLVPDAERAAEVARRRMESQRQTVTEVEARCREAKRDATAALNEAYRQRHDDAMNEIVEVANRLLESADRLQEIQSEWGRATGESKGPVGHGVPALATRVRDWLSFWQRTHPSDADSKRRARIDQMRRDAEGRVDRRHRQEQGALWRDD